MAWWRRFRRPGDAELDEEIRFHLAQEAQLEVERGESPERAAERARRAFGNVLLVRETTRDVWGRRVARDFARDVGYSLRLLRRSPALAAVAVLSLALAVGATTAIFSLADAVIFRKLPVFEPDRLVQFAVVHDQGIGRVHSYPLYRDVRDDNQVFSATAAAAAVALPEPASMRIAAAAPRDIRAWITVVTGNYFQTLGVEAVAGRMLTPDDDRAPGAHPVAVVSHRFVRRALGGDPAAALQTTLAHNGITYQVIGVAPEGFTGISSNDDPDVWLPMMMAGVALQNPGMFEGRRSSSMYVFGRLKPGVSSTAASRSLAGLYAEVQRVAPYSVRGTGAALPMARGVQTLRDRFETPLMVLLASVGGLLLIACANLAGLLVARTAGRQQEIAVRLSLGASRSRLLRQFFAESLLLAVVGAAAGLVVSSFAAAALIDLVTTSGRRLPIAFTLDSRILLFAGAVSAAASFLCGLFPAVQANRTPLVQAAQSVLRMPSRLAGGRLLIGAQMALSLFLLIGAGLFLRSLGNLRGLDTGFDRENVLVVMMDPRAALEMDPEKYLTMYRELPARVAQLPGVRAASYADTSFFGSSTSRGSIAYEGYGRQVPEGERPFKLRVTPTFPETFGLSLVAGRTLADRDDRHARRVAIVSESIATRYYAGRSAVGMRFCFSDRFHPDCAVEIVGVVKDVRYNSLRAASPFTVYIPINQEVRVRGDLQVRTFGDPEDVAGAVHAAIRQFNPRLHVVHTTTLDRLLDESVVQDRLLATLSAAFAVVAVLLGAVGLYGITSYAVHRRTNEIGVRLALGASGSDVRWMVLRDVLAIVLAGAAVGIPAALGAGRLVRSLLFGLSPADPAVIAGSAALLLAVAALAGYLPARRATRIDPVAALRME